MWYKINLLEVITGFGAGETTLTTTDLCEATAGIREKFQYNSYVLNYMEETEESGVEVSERKCKEQSLTAKGQMVE